MKASLLLIIFLASLGLNTFVQAEGEYDTYRSVLKIRTYEYDNTNNTYVASHIGSAVALGNGYAITNAHVVFDSDSQKPDGFYEICRTIDFRKKPICFTTGELVGYDEENDLALLKYDEPSDLPKAPLFRENKINIGAPVTVYGYPSIGGINITRTQGNIAGYDDKYYKVDAGVDHGNSGGGAFNKYGELVGIPTKVSSDNAVIGYMIPITTIRSFLAKKTKAYTPVELPRTESFKKFIKTSQIGERSRDIINDLNISTRSLKKYGLTFGGKSEGTRAFTYAMTFSNLLESYLAYACYTIGGERTLQSLTEEVGDQESAKKYTIERSYTGADNRYMISKYTSLVSKDSGLINIYDTQNTCAGTIYLSESGKDKKSIEKGIAFLTEGITVKKAFPLSNSFTTSTFKIDTIPKGISVMESKSAYSAYNSIEVGYFSGSYNSGESLASFTQKKRDTVDAYFLGTNSYFDDSPSDPDTKKEDYSLETLRKIYEKKYNEDKVYTGGIFEIQETKNGKKVIIGKTTYIEDDENLEGFIFAYPYMVIENGKETYYELNYIQAYEGTNTGAMIALKSFFLEIEPIGTSPF